MIHSRKLLSLLFLGFALSCSCPDKEVVDPCLEQTLSEFKLDLEAKKIKQQFVNGEFHYWLNTDAIHYDGVEYIINAHCDTVCYFCGECYEPSCVSNYNSSEWEIIWEK